MLEESKREHGAQDALYLVIERDQTHLTRLDRLQQVVAKVLRAGHLLV